MTIDLTGKVALVTGGARGIGHATCERFYAAGAHVAILDQARATEGAATLTGKGRALGLQANITSAAEVEQAIALVEGQLGQVDILVNNAGITRDGLLVRMAEADWDAVLNVNLKGAYLMTRLVSRGMMKRRWGRIINISSVVGQAGNPGQANYVSSKAGLIGLTKTLAQEVGSRNITVNAVAPGFIDTDMTRVLPEDVKQRMLATVPLKRMGTPADIAAAVRFLASEEAGYITGQVLGINGGMYM
jgi:3-oxoacyl-[acyl-carrier protein] reductase